MIIEKIDKTTDNGAFEMAFRDGNWNLNPEEILWLFKALIKRHNEMVELVNDLPIADVGERTEVRVKHWNEDSDEIEYGTLINEVNGSYLVLPDDHLAS